MNSPRAPWTVRSLDLAFEETDFCTCDACREDDVGTIYRVGSEYLCAGCISTCCYCDREPSTITALNDYGHPHLVCLQCFVSHWYGPEVAKASAGSRVGAAA